MESEQNPAKQKQSTQARKENTWLITVSLLILAMVALGLVFNYARSVLIPFVLAIFIVVLVSPILDFQVLKLRFARVMAVTVTLLIVLIFIAVLCLLIAEATQTLFNTAARYNTNVVSMVDQAVDRANEWFNLTLNKEKIRQDIQNQIPRLATNAGGTALDFMRGFFLVSIFVIFLLAGRNPHIVHTGVYADIDQKVRRYIATKVTVSAATGIMVWLSLRFFNLELAGFFGMLAFFLNFIPSIGSIVATMLPIPVAIAQYSDNVWLIVAVILIPGAIQMTIGNLIEPKIMGTGLNLHPVTILLALSFWGLLWGIPGMFLAAPMTAAIRIVLMQFETLKPIGRILAGRLPGYEPKIGE